MSRKINQAGLELIKHFEGCKLTAYQDIVGVWTVGFGHTGHDVYPGLTITQEQADNLLKQDLSKFETQVEAAVASPVPLTDNAFAALVSFSYNLGINALIKSSLLRLLKAGGPLAAAPEFLKWSHAGGVLVPGLLKRREAEKELFLKI